MSHVNSYNLNALIGMGAIAVGWPLTLFVITRPALARLLRRHR